MNTKKKRYAPRKRLIKHFLALTLAGSLLLPGLVLIRTEKVEANVITDMAGGVVGKLRYNATIAEIIISLMTGSGAAVTNTNYLNQLNQSYGVNSTLATATGTDGTIGAMMDAGLFSIADDGTFIDNGLLSAIEAQPAYTNCNVDSIMGTWNVDHTVVETAASENIGASIGAGAVIGTISQVGGAFMIGFNLGNLAVNIAEQYGLKMATQTALNGTTLAGAGQRYCGGVYRVGGSFGSVSDVTKTIYAKCYEGNEYSVRIINISNDRIPVTRYEDGRYWSTWYLNAHETGGFGGSNPINITGMSNLTFASTAEANAFAQNPSNVQQYLPYSPDVIGSAGNQRPSNYYSPTSVSSWPNLGRQTPEDKGIEPIPWSDYMDFVQDANDNTGIGDTTINQGDLYNNFIENYFVTPEELPDVVSPDYTPTVPEQPTANVKPENTPEQNQQNTDYMTTPGLKDVFPFSIPWDIAGLFGVFSTNNREAPVVTFPIVSELFGIDEEVTIDLSPYDDVASLLRLLELIAFGLGLAFVTRYLIGAGG